MKQERTEEQLSVAQPAEEIPAAPKKGRLKKLLKGQKRKCLALLLVAAGGLLHRQHPGLRRDPQRYV